MVMNSKQRRKTRAFVHEVVLEWGDKEKHQDFARRLEHARGWLQWQTKRKNYTMGREGYTSQSFLFRNGGIASVFALKWTR